jgi:hypothetical protein
MMLRLWNRKGNAVKKWRSRAWSIDPKVTNLTIIKSEATEPENLELTHSNMEDNSTSSRFSCTFFEAYPQYYSAIADMEQFG